MLNSTNIPDIATLSGKCFVSSNKRVGDRSSKSASADRRSAKKVFITINTVSLQVVTYSRAKSVRRVRVCCLVG